MVEIGTPVNFALEERAVEISINGKKKKVSVIEGMVKGVEGYGNQLRISLDPEKTTYEIRLIEFNGQSPVRRGDRIKAGLIVHPEFPKEAVYIGLLKDAFPNSVYERIDCMRGYEPLHVDARKMGLPD